MREPKWLSMLTTLRPRIVEIMGKTEDPSLFECVFYTLASGWRQWKGGVRRKIPGRSEAEIICSLQLLKNLTLLATRTYEDSPMTTGFVVAEKWRFRNSTSRWRWLAKWPENSLPKVNQWPELIVAAALADGKKSFVMAEPTGSIHGIISVRDSKELIYNAMGYVVTVNGHGEVFLFDQDSEPVCYHDGSRWRRGGYIGPLLWVDHWAHYEREKRLLDKVERGELPVRFSVGKDWKRWLAFEGLIEQLSEQRLPAIFAICDPATLKSSKIHPLVSALRPELDGIRWGHINDNTPVWVNLFKLDGVHFLSREMRIMSICRRISVPAGYGDHEETGRTAARFLSENLDASGVIVEVASDGRVSVLYDGKVVNRWIRLSQ